MKSIMILIFGGSLLVASLALAETTKEAVKEATTAEDGPFYVMDWDEFKNITKEQKSFYLGKLVAEIPKITELKSLTKEKILAAGKDHSAWDEMDEQVGGYCESHADSESCKALRSIRVQTFLLKAQR
jgi:DMSO/TMAO reductase YedYZ molybdopterin-dependent catalytic subunit